MAWFPCKVGGGGGIPAQLQTDMDAVFNKKFGTSTTYPSTEWADDVNLMGLLPVRSASGAIASFADGADDVPLKTATFVIAPTLNGVSAVNISHSGVDTSNPDVTTISLGQTVHGGSVTVDEDGNVTLAEGWKLYTGSWIQYKNNNGFNAYRSTVTARTYNATSAIDNIGNVFGNFSSDNMTENKIQLPTTGVTNFFMALDENEDPDDVILVYREYGDPIPSDLDPITPITSALGVNNIWCDTGDSEVEYRVNVNPTANLWGGLKMAEDISKNVTQGYVYQKGNETTIVSNESALNGKVVLDSSFGFKANTQYTLILSIKNTTTYNNNIYANLLIWYTDGTTTSSATSGTANTKKTYAIVTNANKTIDRIETRAQSGNATIYIDECGLFEGVKTVDDFVPYNRYLIDV